MKTCCRLNAPRDSASFTCPVCGSRWTLAGVGPGDYWEPTGTTYALDPESVREGNRTRGLPNTSAEE